jgi:hypothetical protein
VTFSDSRVVDLVKSDFIPVWESVAPVSIATFDLGDGRTVRGTMGGEIALYFCRPDGRVFDILPALHSPHATYWAIRNALDFYKSTGATDDAIRTHHATAARTMALGGKGALTAAIQRARKDIHSKDDADAATRALGKMAYSKSGMPLPEPVTVVEPGGLDFYKRQVHETLAKSAPRTPQEWKETMFVTIMDQKLTGGEFKYDVDTLAPINLIDE